MTRNPGTRGPSPERPFHLRIDPDYDDRSGEPLDWSELRSWRLWLAGAIYLAGFVAAWVLLAMLSVVLTGPAS